MTYKNVELTINEDELNSFIETEKQKIKYSVHSFDEAFNGTTIKNPTNNINAKYYILLYDDKTYLQSHIPYVGGYEPILIESAEKIIGKHIDNILDCEIFNRFSVQK